MPYGNCSVANSERNTAKGLRNIRAVVMSTLVSGLMVSTTAEGHINGRTVMYRLASWLTIALEIDECSVSMRMLISKRTKLLTINSLKQPFKRILKTNKI